MPRIAIEKGFEDEPVKALAVLAPEQAQAAFAFSGAIYQHTKLPFRVVEGARIRTAQINGCQTCQTWRAETNLPPVLEASGDDVAGSFVGRGDEAPDAAFYAAVADWRTAALFSDGERLAIEFAERMGLDPQGLNRDDGFWERMHAVYSDAQIADLTLAVAGWIAMGRAMHVLGVDPQVCAVPARAAA